MIGAWIASVTSAAKDTASGATLLQWAVALGLGGLVAEALRSFVQRRKMGADYADVIAGTAVKLLEPLNKQIQELQGKLEITQRQLAATNDELTATNTELTATKEELSATQLVLGSTQRELQALRAEMRPPGVWMPDSE